MSDYKHITDKFLQSIGLVGDNYCPEVTKIDGVQEILIGVKFGVQASDNEFSVFELKEFVDYGQETLEPVPIKDCKTFEEALKIAVMNAVEFEIDMMFAYNH